MRKLLLVFFSFILLFITACNSNNGQVVNTANNKRKIFVAPNDSIVKLTPAQKIELATKAKSIDSLFAHYSKHRNFNGAVLVAQYGKVIYKNYFGYADFSKKTPITNQSTFQLASVSKQFTAVSIMILKEKGKLNYEDDVTKYLPNFPYSGITIRQLLTHRSGLPNYMYFCDTYFRTKTNALSNDELINFMAQTKPDRYAYPNRKFEYSNTGYCVLASVVEKISGLRFADFVKQNIFEPLQMNSSIVYSTVTNPKIPNEAIGYVSRNRKAGRDFMDGLVGDKGIYTTAEDMFKWDQALYTDVLVSQATLQEAFSPSSFEKPGKHNYGFGWRLIDWPDNTRLVYHAGWWHGFGNYFGRHLEDKTTVIILSNIVNHSFSSKEVFAILNSKTQNIRDFDL